METTSKELLDVRFGGAFSTKEQYTNATGEIKDGGLLRRTENVKIDKNRGVILNGNDDSVDFQPRTSLGVEVVDQAFVIEAEFMTTQEPKVFDTIISVGGNMYVRYSSSLMLEYGFDVNNLGNWTTYKQTVSAPTAMKKYGIVVIYEPTVDGAKMRMFLDGKEQPPVISEGGKPHVTDSGSMISFGNEIHKKASSRGINGSLFRVVVTNFEGPYHESLVKTIKKSNVEENLLSSSGGPHILPTDLEPNDRIPIAFNDHSTSLAAKGSLVRPLPRQVRWQQYEQTAFIHFGINTYYGVEWGNFNEDPNMFQPTELDTDQWARTLKASGFKLAILTVKHHDGFALYPTRYTKFSVASSTWRDGKGDVLREFVNSMRKYGIKIGIYLSPSDHGAYTDGILANGSTRSERTIPTLVEDDDRATDSSLPYFTLLATDYGEMLLNQLYEVLTEYGEVDEVWFDGAQGNLPGNEEEIYDWDSYYSLINSLAPEAVIAVTGNDVRWVGNESGWARENEWSVLAAKTNDDGRQEYYPEFDSPDLGSRDALVSGAKQGMNYLTWWPAEVDVSIRTGWFYHDNQQPKSVEELRDIYYQSVGRNSVLLLNIPPDKRGKFADIDVERLKEWYQSIKNDFAINHAVKATISAENGKDGTDPYALINDIYNSSWQAASTLPSTITFVLEQDITVDKVVLQEDINHGQQVESFVIDVRIADGSWKQIVSSGVVGYKRIVVFEEEVIGKEFRVRISRSRSPVHLSKIGLYQTLPEGHVNVTEKQK